MPTFECLLFRQFKYNVNVLLGSQFLKRQKGVCLQRKLVKW